MHRVYSQSKQSAASSRPGGKGRVTPDWISGLIESVARRTGWNMSIKYLWAEAQGVYERRKKVARIHMHITYIEIHFPVLVIIM